MTKIIGHRGARGLAPENTLPSFAAALKYNVDEVELDVRVTKDGQCVLNHDPWLHDKKNRPLRLIRIANYRLAELRKIRPDLARFDDIVRFIDHRVPIIIEVKPKVPCAEIIIAIRKLLADGWSPKELRLASFSQRTLNELQFALPEIEKVVNAHLFGVSATWRARRLGAKRIALNHHMICRYIVRILHKKGYNLAVHSLNNPKKAARWSKYGLFAVVTDRPDLFQK